MTPQTAPAPTIVPAWPDGPGFEIPGTIIPESETFVILGAGGEEEITRAGGNGLPSQSKYIATGTVEGYVETDSLDVSNVNFMGSAGTLTVNGVNAGTAPTVTNASSSVTAFSVNPTNNATYQLTSETQTCYLLPLSGGEAPPPPEPPPCDEDCGDPGDPDPGPEAVQSQQITLTQIQPFAEGSGYPTSQGGCIAVESSPISVTFTGVPRITSTSQQFANVNSSGTFTVTGTNLVDSEGVSTPSFNTTISSTVATPGQSSESVSFSVPSTQTPGSYQFTISNMWGTSNAVSFTVPYSPVTVTGISPNVWTAGQSYQAVQITGTNFGSTPTIKLSDPTITVSAPYNTSSASPTSGASTTYVNLSVPATTPSEPVVVTVTPGSFGSSFTQVPGGPSLPGSNTAAVIGLQQSACPAMLDSNSGFSAIASTGTGTGGSGTMTVSFSSGSFNGNSVTVPYGPNSTPESIASHLAAFITKNYHSSGLYAQSLGSYILYKSNTTLGNAALTASGSSFAPNSSAAACPPVNLKYILAVTTDSVVWTAVQNSGQRGRQLTYVLINKPTADIPVSSFQRVNPPNSITEYLTANGYSSSSNPNTGEFDDVLGNNSLCNCNSGVFNTYRYFTATVNGQALGTVPIYDQTGAHKQDYIQITFPNGPSILNHWTNPDGTPKDISLP